MSKNQSDFCLLKVLHHNHICMDPSCIEDTRRPGEGPSECWKYFRDLSLGQYLELVTAHFYKQCLDPWWTEIKEGRKLFEGRIRNKIWKYIKKGDLITFKNQSRERFTIKVIEVHHYLNFNAAYDKHQQEMIPESIMNNENRNADQIYHDLLINTAYGGDEEKYQLTLDKNGVIAIEMELIFD